MSVRRGIGILDLLPFTTGIAGGIPDAIVEQIGVLTVLDHRATTSAEFFVHEGMLQSLADALDVDTRDWVVRIPGLTHGLPFRLAVQRTPAATGAQEGAPVLWTLDIQVWNLEVLLPRMRAARQVGGSGVVPLHLEPVQGHERKQRVFLVGRGVVRIAGGGPAGTQVQVVDAPDPLDPTAPTGTVLRFTARPPHFLFGDSQFGMTLDQLVVDASRTFTPAEVVARGHDETWQGVAFREATFYFPPDTPLVHSLSISTRDVIVGDPGGLQGELRVEFGQDFQNQYNTHIQVFQQGDDGDTPVPETTPEPRGTALQFAVALDDQGRPRRVRARFGIGDGIPGRSNLGIVGVWWKLPTGQEGNSAATPYFDAPTTGILQYRLRVGDPGASFPPVTRPTEVPAEQIELSEVTVSFPRTGGASSTNPPLVDAVIAGTTLHNVVHLRGPRERLAGVTLRTRGGIAGTWSLGSGTAPAGTGQAPSFTLPRLAEGSAGGDLTLRTADGVRRIRIDVVPSTPLAIGHQASADPASTAVVTVVDAGQATPSDVLDTFRAGPFHARGERISLSVDTAIAGTHVTVPQGTIAEVEVPVPAGGDQPPAQSTQARSNAVQVLYPFSGDVPLRVVDVLTDDSPVLASDPDASKHENDARVMALGLGSRSRPSGATVAAQLRTWVNTPPGVTSRKYYVVGRTDDLWFNGNLAENNEANRRLAGRRRDAAVQELIAAGVPASDIFARIETEAFAGTISPEVLAAMPRRIRGPIAGESEERLALPAAARTTPPGQSRPVWNSRWTADWDSNKTPEEAHRAARDDRNSRDPYRCAEIWMYVPPPAMPPSEPPSGGQGVPTSMLVPGRDGDPPPAGSSTTTSPPPTDYRVRLRARWDSPTVVTMADAIPTEAEALVAWRPAQIELPPAQGKAGRMLPEPTGADYWEVLLHWTYDARTTQTEVSGALSLPDGAVQWRSDALAGALAFGPAFTALLDPASTIADPAGQFVAASALIVVGAALGELLNTGDGPESMVEIDRLSLSYRWNGATRVTASVDYTVDLRVNVSVQGAGSLEGELRLRYRGVGLRFDANAQGLQGVALTYDDLSVEVVNPGRWSLGGPLGNLIRIAASRIGNSSQWMEFDLEFALDLGVVCLEGATIRLGIEPFSIELRGLTASVQIDNVLEGRGSVTIGDGGAFRALLALQIIPAKVGAYGSLAVDQDFVAVEVGVQLPVGIPLANTGLGLFGFMGRFVANGTRNLADLDNLDPVQRQIDWYLRSPELKYRREPGQFALGVGTVIGTLPDGGFTFNAEGSIAVGFPDFSVILGIDAKLAKERKLSATESGSGEPSTFRIIGLTIFEPEAIMIAVRASYEIPDVLRLEVPLSAYFPLQGTDDAWYIRIGTDNHPSRPGSPATIVLLPGMLDVRAWAFILIEERGLHELGGSLVPRELAGPLDFDGFAIGMGAGFELRWTAGPFRLEVSAFLLVGIGTKPLLFAGAMGVRGELDLVIASVSVDGLIHFHVTPGYRYLDGHFCGHVDLFFFQVEGCVELRMGDDPPVDIPEPPSPLLGMDLCDHLAAVKGRAARSPSTDVPTVWPDTVAVLHFGHYVEDALGGSADFIRAVAPPAAWSAWSGSTELKYAYRLTQVALYRLTGADPGSDASWTRITGPFDSTWWLPTHRRGAIVGHGETGPSTEEGRELGLFHWDPRAWSRWLGEGSQDLPGDPGNTVGAICDQVPPAEPSCAFGRDAQLDQPALARFQARPAPGTAFPSRFHVRARLADELSPTVVAALAGDEGWTWLPGSMAVLHGPITLHGETLTEGWRLPSLVQADAFMGTLPIDFHFSRPLESGELVLEVCADRKLGDIDTGCDGMPREQGVITSFTGVSGTQYSGNALLCTVVDGEHAIVLELSNMRGDHPDDVPEVSVDVRPGAPEPVLLVALDAAGKQLGTAESQGPERQIVRVAAAGIRSAILIPKPKRPAIFHVCWGTGNAGPLAGLIGGVALTSEPVVTAFDAAGNALALEPHVVEATQARAGLAGAGMGVLAPPCAKLVYRLPHQGDTGVRAASKPGASSKPGDGGWVRVAVQTWRRGDVALVAACGVTLEAVQAQQAEQGFRLSLANLLEHLVGRVEAQQPTRAVYLEPASTYQVRVRWQWQGFRPASPGAEPAPPSASGWLDASQEDRFTFHTAALGQSQAPLPARSNSLETDPAQGGPGYDERRFDPRGLARYVTRVTPGHEDAPHFLDDRIGVWFLVDHLEPLIEKYARILQVKVLRTDPAPGFLFDKAEHVPGARHLLDVTLGTSKQIETLTWFDADFRFVEAAAAAPCVNGRPALGSSSVSVTADLQPAAEYDLLLMVAPRTVGEGDEVPVVRSHFRTSRYRNPGELLHALGFATPTEIVPPNDFITETPLAAGTPAVGDAALDGALFALGMDPWPLPAGPRTTVVWARSESDDGQPWRVAAVLLEADEPIWRAGFRTGAVGEPEPWPRLAIGSVVVRRTYEVLVPIPGMPGGSGKLLKLTASLGTLTEHVRNAAGTRVLFVAATPIAVENGLSYDLELSFHENGAQGARGTALLFDRPITVFQEGE